MRNRRNRCEEGRVGGAEVAAAGDGSVCAAITYCSIATISQPPTIRISHQCCIMEQITRLRIYRHSSTGKIAKIWNILNSYLKTVKLHRNADCMEDMEYTDFCSCCADKYPAS